MRAQLTAARIPLLLLAVPIIASAACNKKPTLTFELDVPADVASRAAWYEIGAFAGSTCPPSSQFAGGVPSGSAARLAFAANDAAPPGIGDLARGTYAFAAAAKADDCGVIGVGCAVVDVSSADGVTIALHVNDPPTGACEAGGVCQDAECVPSTDNSDPSVGAGCSLDFLGAGPFSDPLAISGTLASTPAISATDSGFVIAYREYDPVQGVARLTLLSVDSSGGLGPTDVETLSDTCPDEDESDAVGMAYNGADGLVAIARAPCTGSGGFDLFDVSTAPAVNSLGKERSATLATSALALSNAHAVAPAPSGFYVVFTKGDAALLNTSQNAQFSATSSIPVGGAPPQTGVWVATSNQVLALLAASPNGAAPPDDAGGSEGGSPPVADAGTGSVLRLNVAASGSNPATLGAPIEFPGTWGSLAAEGSRVFVATSGDQTLPVTWLAFDLGGTAPVTQDGFAVQASSPVSYADVAFHQDNLFFAVESVGALSLVSYAHATTPKPTFSREVVLGQNPRIPSLRGLREGRVAIAASDTRVAIAWVTGRELGPDDAVGGYAIFACR